MFYYTDQTEPKKWITGLSDLIRREQIELATLATYEILELEKQAKELFNIMEQLNDALRKLSKLEKSDS